MATVNVIKLLLLGLITDCAVDMNDTLNYVIYGGEMCYYFLSD